MIKQILSTFLFFSVGISSAFAANARVMIDGSKPGFVPLSQPAVVTSAKGVVTSQQNMTANKQVLFQHIVLSADAKRYLAQHVDDAQDTTAPLAVAAAPMKAVENGMDNVPVLDQGMHGTCVTFATTAALDAVYHHGDYISQLCNLSLGKYLASVDSSYLSGWDGADIDVILAQLKTYGVINKAYQTQQGCGGFKNYPLYQERMTGGVMAADDFTQHSQKIMDNISYRSLLKLNDAFSAKADTTGLLYRVKQALTNGHRVVIGALIDDLVDGNGVQASYKASYDSWVLTPAIKKDAKAGKIEEGHAIVVTGYDDNAVIVDFLNKPHKGVLTIRNSWSVEAGDHGTYYMSYDYFRALVIEAEEIIPMATS